MSRPSATLTRRYAAALNGYLADGDEAQLMQAHEIGRAALSDGLGLLDLALMHHQILAGLLMDHEHRRTMAWLEPAAIFFAECLSVFEMQLTGYREANERLARANVDLKRAKGETEHAHARLLEEIVERERAEAALRQSQRLQAIGQLSGGIAHHFNNLLTVIMGNVHMARRRVGDDAKLARLLDSASIGAERGAAVTRQLLAFSRRQMLKPEPLDPTVQLAGAAELIAGALGASVRIERDFPDELWPIEIDATELDLALVNLGLNARDAMGGEGVLTLRASNQRVRDTALGLDGDYLVIEVADTGAGIDPETMPKVFDPFFTTKGGSGTGLGLSQVHGFAHQSGGAVAIASKPGLGTTVTLYLPATPRPAAAAASGADDSAAEEPAAKGTVLVVDDDEGVAGVAASLLEDYGFEVRLAYRARAALDVLRSEGAVDLLFSDIVMPDGMDGIALAQEVRRLRPSLPILLTTGYSEVLADGRAELQGFPVLPKPYKAADLRQGVMSLLRRAA